MDSTIYFATKQMESFKPNTKLTPMKGVAITALKSIISTADSTGPLIFFSVEKIFQHVSSILKIYKVTFSEWVKELFNEYSLLLQSHLLNVKGYCQLIRKSHLRGISFCKKLVQISLNLSL